MGPPGQFPNGLNVTHALGQNVYGHTLLVLISISIYIYIYIYIYYIYTHIYINIIIFLCTYIITINSSYSPVELKC